MNTKRPKRYKKEELSMIKNAILKRLSEDGSRTPHKIAELTGYSYKVVKPIYDKLIEDNIVKIKALINPYSEVANKKIVIFHFYKVTGGAEKIETAAKLIAQEDFIEEAHSIVGEWDLLVKFRVSDFDEYNELLNKKIWDLLFRADITNSRGMVTVHSYKDEAKYEIPMD